MEQATKALKLLDKCMWSKLTIMTINFMFKGGEFFHLLDPIQASKIDK
jgi:hypothetical protein